MMINWRSIKFRGGPRWQVDARQPIWAAMLVLGPDVVISWPGGTVRTLMGVGR